MTSLFIFVLLAVAGVQASPPLVSRQGITTLSTAQINSFDPYTHLAAASYCSPSAAKSWSCGAHCAAIPDFKPVATGGDGDAVQYWFVGHSQSLNSVIVAHQGSTNASKIGPLLTDANVVRGNLNSSLFPGVSDSIEVHHGFQDEHAKTASQILSAIQTAMSKYNSTSVTMVGHSLGAAVSLLDSVYLPMHLQQGTTFRSVLYGLPRVGNLAFANYVDANLHITHINNLKDPVPIMPGRLLGYVHPSGEVHITDNNTWKSCPGQDNPSSDCIVGAIPVVTSGNAENHNGPYNGILMGCAAS